MDIKKYPLFDEYHLFYINWRYDTINKKVVNTYRSVEGIYYNFSYRVPLDTDIILADSKDPNIIKTLKLIRTNPDLGLTILKQICKEKYEKYKK